MMTNADLFLVVFNGLMATELWAKPESEFLEWLNAEAITKEEPPTEHGRIICNRWISVKETLPEKNQIVIASDGEHTWDVGMYRSLCGKLSEWNWKKNTVKTVLWWMPKDGALPEPPKEGKPECD